MTTTPTPTPPLTSTSSSSSFHHLLGLLLTSHIYLNLSIIPWNTPSGYLTMANVEFELSHGTIRKGGSNPNPYPPPSLLVDIPPTSIEKNYLKAIELNQQLELLSQQGIPVQDTIDTSIAYNQLGLYYLTLYEQTQQQQQQQQQPYAALAYESFQTSLHYNSQRYESKLNLVILLNYLGYEHEAIQLLLEIYHNLLHIPHTDTDTDTDTALPTYSYSLYWTVGNTLEKFQQYNEAKECYEMILRVFKVSNDHPSYGMIEKNIERLVVLLADQAKRGGGAGGEKRQ